MDPRRARDPRLARADPRLQRVSSGSPAPPTPQQQPWPPTDSQQVQSQTPPNANSNLPASLNHDASSASIYKPRPLFCVVCASNQVNDG
ncbi:hypothetical protein OG21DRAFT_993712 [Imleria badia]|nr:hypothetical protein OG21DRAFT_993712 [Imleria badia]